MQQRDLERAATDVQGRTSRRAAAAALHQSLDAAGTQLQLEGHLLGDGRVSGSSPNGNGDESQVGVGYLCRIASALQSGACSLIEIGNPYAAAALVRQMVEVEGLLWAFSTGHEDAGTWLNSTQRDRMRLFQPRHVRKRSNGRFRASDYRAHCEHGGHPTPGGARLLFDAGAYPGEAMLCESLIHTRASWRSAMILRRVDDADEVGSVVQHWLDSDPLASALASRSAPTG